MKIDQPTIVKHVLDHSWSQLIGMLRDWYTAEFKLWQRDVIETAVGEWVVRMIIRSAQIAAGKVDREDWLSELRVEVQTYVLSAHLQYKGYMQRLDRHPSAEDLVRIATAWMKNAV